MIEPYVSEKQCTKCGQCKPLTEFPIRKNRACGFASHCTECRRTYHRMQARRSRAGLTNKQEPVTAVPLPAMDEAERNECVRFRKWGGAEPNARFGVPSIGVAA